MRKIPQILLQARRESLSNQLDHTISRKLDESMTELHTQALARVDQRLRQKKISKDVSNQPALMESLKQRLLIEELRISLSQIFSRTNLLVPAKYTALEQSIQHWCPWSMEVQQSGSLVKQLLIEMLPDARKQQQLKNICADYKAHLTAKIEGEFKSEHPKVYKAYQAQPPQVFGGPTLKGGLQTQASFDPCRPLERFLTETAPQLKNPSTSLKSAMDNFQAVRRLETTLENPIKPVTKQVQDFSHQFKTERVVIEKNPDSYAMQFIKSALDYLSRGWIQKLGFWRVRGQEASQQIEKTLKPPMIPPMPTSIPILGG